MPVNCSVFLPPIIKQNKKHKTFSHFPVNLIWSIPFREERPNVMPLRKDKFLDGTSINIRSEDYFWLCRSNSLPLCFFALFTCGDQGTLYDPVECWKEWGAQRQGGQGQLVFVCHQSEAAARILGEVGLLAWLVPWRFCHGFNNHEAY